MSYDLISSGGISPLSPRGLEETSALATRRTGADVSAEHASKSGDKLTLSGREQANIAETYSREQILRNYSSPSDALANSGDPSENGLTEEDKAMIDELRERDREVRAHEQTHAAMLGPYARGGPSYTYQTGPDGRMYAVGGSVEVDTGKEATSEETANKARVLQMAATAVSEPSVADMAIAANAAAMLSEAMTEMF